MKFVLFLLYLIVGFLFSGYLSGMIFVLMAMIKTHDIKLIERFNNDGTFETYVDHVLARKKNAFERICEITIWPVTMVLVAYDVYRLFIDDYRQLTQK